MDEVFEFSLENNPLLLIDIPCDQLPKWQEISQFTPPQMVNNKMALLNDKFENFDILTLVNASGKVVNMDFFSVNITTLPSGMSAQQFLEHIRRNINDFIDVQYSEFSTTSEVNTGYNEDAIWNSSNPIGAILHIEIAADDGSVICSEHQSNRWRFSTIRAPWDYDHPVSGTREFGFTQNDNGSFTFYTRGVDRFTQRVSEIVASALFDNKFEGADNLWKSFQQGITNYVSTHGGSASINQPVYYRPDYNHVKAVLDGTEPSSSLGCK